MDELAGRCGKCGNRLEFRLVDCREDEEDEGSKILCWLVNGVCGKCRIVYCQDIIKQEKEPELDDEFSINWDKDAVGNSSDFIKGAIKDSQNVQKGKSGGNDGKSS